MRDAPYMTPPAVAHQLRVKADRVIGWIRSGQLHAVNVGDGAIRPRWRISPAALDTFLAGRAAAPPITRTARRRKDPGVTEFF